MRRPSLDDIVGGVSAPERDRLQRVHELLIEADPHPSFRTGWLNRPPSRYHPRSACSVGVVVGGSEPR